MEENTEKISKSAEEASMGDDTTSTSTDSETFGSWTLVAEDKKAEKDESTKNSADVKTTKDDDDETTDRAFVEHQRRLENVEGYVETENANKPIDSKSSLDDSSIEDFSDGISIISESESSGRLSPHPNLRQHLKDLTVTTTAEYDLLALNTTMTEVAPSTKEIIKNRRRYLTSSNSTSNQELQSTTEIVPDDNAFSHLQQMSPTTPKIRNGLSAIFYIGVLVALTAFIGRLYLPALSPAIMISSNQPLSALEQKLNDMELQHNLMRAEIDILTKQVNYLSNLQLECRKTEYKVKSPPINDKYSEKETKYEAPKPINADSSSHRNNEATPKIYDEFRSEFEIYKNIFDNIKANIEIDEKKPPENINRQEKRMNKEKGTMRENFNKDFSEKYHNKNKQEFHNYKEYLIKPESEIVNNKRRRSQIDQDFSDDQRFQKRFESKDQSSNDKYKTHHQQQYNINEMRQQIGKDGFPEKKDGHWHEKYMQHRANERQNNDKKRNDKNWFIERGNSREHTRYR